MATHLMELHQETDNLYTIYDKTKCIGNFQFEDWGRCKAGCNLRWADSKPPYNRHCIHFAFSTRDTIFEAWQQLVLKHIYNESKNKQEARI